MADQNSQYMAMLTAVGEAKLANATALGVNLNITQLGVGDANGAEPMPSRTQTALINERRRAPLNQLSIDPNNSAIIIAEQVIPEDIGGWWIREIGLYDEAGDLVAVANCPPTYKPELAQGSGRTQVVRLNILVSSTQSISLKIDPSVVLATRKYVDDLTVRAGQPEAEAGTENSKIMTPLRVRQAIAYFGIGGQAVKTETDLDLYTTAGKFTTPASGLVKLPTDWPQGRHVIEVAGGTSYCIQLLYAPTPSSKRAAWRVYAAGVWSAWTEFGTAIATQTDAEAGTEATKVMTPLRVWQAISSRLSTQLQAEDGTDNSTAMTPLRVFQAIAKKVVNATELDLGVAKLATQGQTDSGTDDATIVTPKKLRWGFAISLAANGYIAFPTWLGGLIVQWGSIATLANNADTLFSLPIAFPTQGLQVVASASGPNSATANIGATFNGNTQIKLNCSHASTVGTRLIALGH